jgi:protein-tyrosine phosphatase
MDEALALLAAQAAAGVRTVVATSHVNHTYAGVNAESIGAGVGAVRAGAADAGIDVEVLAGAEVSLTRAMDMDDDALAALRLGGPWLLLEPPHGPTAASTLEFAITSLQHRGHRILLAHPERCPAFHDDPESLRRLVAGGVRCSVTAGAVSGAFGRTVRRFALDLFAQGLVHNLASDAHGGMASRPPGLIEHLAGTGYEKLGPWLCEEMPRAMLAGDALPPAPHVEPPRRGGLSRLLRRN